MKRYYRKNRSSVALFLVSNLLAAGSSVFMSFLLGTFADSAMEGDLSRVWKIALVTLFYLCIETFFRLPAGLFTRYRRPARWPRPPRRRCAENRSAQLSGKKQKRMTARTFLSFRMMLTPSSRIMSRHWAKFIFRSAASCWRSPLLSPSSRS